MKCPLCETTMDFEEEDTCYRCGYCGHVIEYAKVNFTLGDTIESAVNQLWKHKEKGQLVYGKFNGVTLYSDTVTMDDAYKAITGKTKAELESI